MPCGQYCYQRKWQCEGGRLRQLTNVQKQPGPTRNYGSEGARENSIRRRVMSVKTTGSKTNYGPLFGKKKKPSVFSNCGYCGDRGVEGGKNVYYNNGGTSSTNTYWNKIAVGPKGVGGMVCCCQDEQTLTIDWNDGPLAVVLSVGDELAVLPVTPGARFRVGLGVITRIISGDTGSNQWIIVVRPYFGACLSKAPPALALFAAGVISDGATVSPFYSGSDQSFGVMGLGVQEASITASPPQSSCDKNRLCGGDNGTTLLGGAHCSIGGKNWLNYRRFHPHGAKS